MARNRRQRPGAEPAWPRAPRVAALGALAGADREQAEGGDAEEQPIGRGPANPGGAEAERTRLAAIVTGVRSRQWPCIGGPERDAKVEEGRL